PAAQIWERLGAFTEAAQDYAAAGAHEQASWILVHHIGDVQAARAELAVAEAAAAAPAQAGPAAAPVPPPTVAQTAAELRRRLIWARCNAAEDVARSETLVIFGEVMRHLEHDVQPLAQASIEQMAVAVAEAMSRPDLVALVFAAAVRGGRHQAA